jgi:hypothetical protein
MGDGIPALSKAVGACVDKPPPQPHPIALAMEWVAKITTVSLEMFLPAIGGGYLDRRFGTSYLAILGLVLGVTVGIWHLLQMTQTAIRKKRLNKKENSDRGSSETSGT